MAKIYLERKSQHSRCSGYIEFPLMFALADMMNVRVAYHRSFTCLLSRVSCLVHFLETKLCMVCPGDFEIVDLEMLDTYLLLDTDVSLDVVQRGEDIRPLCIYRVERGPFVTLYG